MDSNKPTTETKGPELRVAPGVTAGLRPDNSLRAH